MHCDDAYPFERREHRRRGVCARSASRCMQDTIQHRMYQRVHWEVCFCVPVIPGELKREPNFVRLRYTLCWGDGKLPGSIKQACTHTHTAMQVCECFLQWWRNLLSVVVAQHCCSCSDLDHQRLVTIPLHEERPASKQKRWPFIPAQCIKQRGYTWMRHDAELSTSLYGARKRDLWSWFSCWGFEK